MRFLQTEWHTHERTRNAWEIEREEMKKRIATLEGEARSSKGLRGVLERQIRMLEYALRKERENVNKLKKGEPVDLAKDTKELARQEIDKLKEAGKGESHSFRFASLLICIQWLFQSPSASSTTRSTLTTIYRKASDRRKRGRNQKVFLHNAPTRSAIMSYQA